MKMYTTKRKGNDERTYVGANINNRQFEMKVPSKDKILMSKGMGKVLDSKVGKAGIKVGNKIIKGAKWAFPVREAMMKEGKMLNAPGEKLRKEHEMERTGQVARRKGRSTSDGYMRMG